jgi:epoxyqueuosine reductase
MSVADPKPAKREQYQPKAETLALLKVSGNAINGVGETKTRRPSPFFWHPPDQHPWGELQILARQNSRKCPGSAEVFKAAYNHPELVPVAEERRKASAEVFAAEVTQFALEHEADAIGIAPRDTALKSPGSSFSRLLTIMNGSNRFLRMRQTVLE